MKNIFPEYNSIDKKALKDLWLNGTIVFDSGVLLNLYSYSDETARSFIETIMKFKHRIWLPYQVGYEFNKNRLDVITDQKKQYSDFEKRFNDIVDDADRKSRSAFLSQKLTAKLKLIKEEIKKEVSGKQEIFDASLKMDKLFSEINTAFLDNVGAEPSKEELKLITTEGAVRYKNKVPPGYQSNYKPEPQKFADLIIWKQLISYSKANNTNIIFVLNEKSDDWWLNMHGKNISPRPELIKEFREEANRVCYFCQPYQFLSRSNEYLGNDVEDSVIEEVKYYNTNFIPPSSKLKANFASNGVQEELAM